MALPTPTAPTVTLESGNDTKIYLKSGSAPTVSERVPVVGEINYQPQGSVESVPIHGDNGWDRSVKNGLSATVTFRTMAPDSNAVVAEILTAADSVGSAAQLLGIIELPDGRYYSGAFIVNQAVPVTPTRGVFAYDVTLTSDGDITAS